MANKGRFTKMRLIPEDEYERLKQKIVKEYDPRLAAMVSASDQSILPSGFPADPSQLKFQLNQYNHAMDTFRTLKNNKHLNPLPEIKKDIPIMPPLVHGLHDILPPLAPPQPLVHPGIHATSSADFEARGTIQADEDQSTEMRSSRIALAENPVYQMALEAVPGNYRRKAEQSLEFIKMRPEKISVTNDLELVLDGVPQAGTNFVDLFASLYKAPTSKKSSLMPKFQSEFHNLLSELNMPNTYLPSKAQSGKGFPPGRQPHILHVYK